MLFLQGREVETKVFQIQTREESFSKINGIETNPKSNAPAEAICVVSVTPKNAAAAGMAIEPPIPTSATSFIIAC